MASVSETNRIEAFSDGVFAIAITLLVLDLKIPREAPGAARLSELLIAQWPAYLAFLTSFATILIMWINHHRIFTLVGRSDDRLLFYNGLLLLGVTIVPFPTALVAEYLQRDGEQSAAFVFNGTYIFIAVAFNLLWRTAAVNDRLLHQDADRAKVDAIFAAYRYGPIWYVIAFVLAFVTVTGSLLLNLALAVYFAWPTRRGLTSSRSPHATVLENRDADSR